MDPGGREGCPDTGRWVAVACGLVTELEAAPLLDHAGNCASCAEKLRGAILTVADETDSPEEEFFKSLGTSQPDWRRDIARRLAADRPR